MVLIRSKDMFEYDNGILVCKEHRTPAQKNEDGLCCRKCNEEAKTQDED